MILLLKLEERSCKGCKVRNELSVVTNLTQKNSDTLVGGGQDFTAETFSGSVDTPCADKICPTNGQMASLSLSLSLSIRPSQ